MRLQREAIAALHSQFKGALAIRFIFFVIVRIHRLHIDGDIARPLADIADIVVFPRLGGNNEFQDADALQQIRAQLVVPAIRRFR